MHGINFFITAVHELGHVLGLDDMENNSLVNNVMFAYLERTKRLSDIDLGTEDKKRLAVLYGKHECKESGKLPV